MLHNLYLYSNIISTNSFPSINRKYNLVIVVVHTCQDYQIVKSPLNMQLIADVLFITVHFVCVCVCVIIFIAIDKIGKRKYFVRSYIHAASAKMAF